MGGAVAAACGVSSLLFGLPALLSAWTPKAGVPAGATNPVGLPCGAIPQMCRSRHPCRTCRAY
ncbi:MAG: hypothetical protein ACLRMJ_01365 [Alistipes finegoldii]